MSNERLRQMLCAAAERFREYEAHHRKSAEQHKAGDRIMAWEGATEKAERNAHIALLCETALEFPDDPSPAVISDGGRMTVRLDLALSNTSIREGHLTVRLPTLPNPGEALQVGDEKFLVHARIHTIDAAGDYVCGLLVEKPDHQKSVVAAPASALDRLNAQRGGGIILGRG